MIGSLEGKQNVEAVEQITVLPAGFLEWYHTKLQAERAIQPFRHEAVGDVSFDEEIQK